MGKLPNIFNVDFYPLSQTTHGSSQGYQALDFSYQNLEIIAPIDCEVKNYHQENPVGQSWFDLYLSNDVFLRIVHALPIKVGRFNKGEKIATMAPYFNTQGQHAEHFHIAMNDRGVWQCVLAYLEEKTIKLIGNWQNQFYSSWEWVHQNWGDFQLSFIASNEMDEAIQWNDLIKEKKILDDGGKLVNKLDTQYMKDTLLFLHKFTKYIQENNLENNARIETVLNRYINYLNNSTNV